MSTIIFNNVSFAYSAEKPILSNATVTFNKGKTGIVGRNGVGKSTLFRLILGELKPQQGTITVPDSVGYLPQLLTLDSESTIADLFGVHDKLVALERIEAGSTKIKDYDTLGDDWEIREQVQAKLDEAGLSALSIDRKINTLSGGETILCALTGLQFQEFPIVLLDEPTNNLDMETKAQLYQQLKSWQGTLLIISHDTELLELMDETCELYDHTLKIYGGGYSLYREVLEGQQNKAKQQVKTAQQAFKNEKKQQIDKEKKLATRNKVAKKAQATKGLPKSVVNTFKNKAEVSAGKFQDKVHDKVAKAQEELDSEIEKLRTNSSIRIDLPDPQIPTHKVLAKLHSPFETIVLEGKSRVVLTGRNGVGKTRLLNSLFKHDNNETYAEAFTQRIGYVTQHLGNLSEDKSLLENIKEANPNALDNDVRAQLARFLFKGDQVDKLAKELSGGERFRLALAKILLTEPANQLIVLDEPSNNLDLDSVNELVSALSNYNGALLVVSHDKNLIEQLKPNSRVEMRDSGLTFVGLR
ncbi:MAG: ABC-F family ATP-binding cassette domain-containing protein [Micrococcaceae bacterium]